jgi:hypothetical protein
MPAAVPIALGVSGIASAGASLIGSSEQANAANNAANMQEKQYQETRSDLLPFTRAGQSATNMLTQQLPALSAPITMDEATLRQTPGYEFNLNQGLKSVQNGAAARGLGSSGAALKGAAGYATGLADSTYQNQFNNAVTNKLNAYNMLSGVAGLGENAAAKTGDIGTQLAGNAGNALMTGANASATGLNGAANALTNAGQQYLGYNWAQNNPYSNNPFTGQMTGIYGGHA